MIGPALVALGFVIGALVVGLLVNLGRSRHRGRSQFRDNIGKK